MDRHVRSLAMNTRYPDAMQVAPDKIYYSTCIASCHARWLRTVNKHALVVSLLYRLAMSSERRHPHPQIKPVCRRKRCVSRLTKKYSATGFFAGIPLLSCGAASKTLYLLPGAGSVTSSSFIPSFSARFLPSSPLLLATVPPLLASSPSSRIAATFPHR